MPRWDSNPRQQEAELHQTGTFEGQSNALPTEQQRRGMNKEDSIQNHFTVQQVDSHFT